MWGGGAAKNARKQLASVLVPDHTGWFFEFLLVKSWRHFSICLAVVCTACSKIIAHVKDPVSTFQRESSSNGWHFYDLKTGLLRDAFHVACLIAWRLVTDTPQPRYNPLWSTGLKAPTNYWYYCCPYDYRSRSFLKRRSDCQWCGKCRSSTTTAKSWTERCLWLLPVKNQTKQNSHQFDEINVRLKKKKKN